MERLTQSSLLSSGAHARDERVQQKLQQSTMILKLAKFTQGGSSLADDACSRDRNDDEAKDALLSSPLLQQHNHNRLYIYIYVVYTAD